MSLWGDWLAQQAAEREAAGLTRVLRPRRYDDPTVDLAGNDYLGLSQHPAVRQAAASAAELWGGGAGASRLVTGTLTLHDELETTLAEVMGQPAALVLSTGYHANLAILTALADRDTHVVSDAHIHASLIDGVRLSRSPLTVVPHNDVAAVGAALAGVSTSSTSEGSSTSGVRVRQIVVVESIYSVLGDRAPLRELAELCEEHDALLVVDEAHGLGVHGAGVVAQEGLAGHPNVVVTATLSKALGSQGGAVLGSRALVEHLVNRARPFIFDTGLAPASAAAALAALRLFDDARPALIRRRTHDLAALLSVDPPEGAVLSVPMPSPTAAVEAAADCAAAGVRVGCFRPPSVPDGISRLRITANAGVSDDDWARACALIHQVVKEHR